MAKRRSYWAVGNSNIAFFTLDEKMPPDSGSTGIPIPDVPTSSATGRGIARHGRAQPGRHETKNHAFVERGGIQSVDLR
jgi:hypothetical protein